MKITSKTTKPELIAYATTQLGVELDEREFSRDELIAEVKKIETSLGITAENPDQGDDTNNDTESHNKAENKHPRFVMLRIHTPPMPNDDEDTEPETHCIVGFNGKNYQIEFDVEEGVKVPYGVYDVIKNAVQTRYRRVKGKRELEARQEQRYKFNVVKFID